MKFESITIKDIAKALGMSASTVSRALRDSYEISPKTKARVNAFAKEYNYIPNPIALSLKERKTMSIGVLVSAIANNFFSQVIDGIESVANANKYNVIIMQSKDSFEREKMLLNYIAARSIDGLIISISSETDNYEVLKQIQDRGMPIVFFDRALDEIQTHKVTLNNVKGAYDATIHLMNNGFKKIAVIASNKNLSMTRARVEGYKQALLEKNTRIKENYIRYCSHGGGDVDEVHREVDALLNMKGRPDAIFTLADQLTTTTLGHLKQLKIKIPNDIALIGFSNSNETSLLNPSLSVIHQPALEMGHIAATQLFQLINNRKKTAEYMTTVLEPELIIRESSTKF